MTKIFTRFKNQPFLWILLVVFLWLLSFLLYFLPEHGTFGDMFGAVNALFSGLAFAGLGYTIKLQQQEISINKHHIYRQNFENGFFHLLDLWNKSILNIKYVKDNHHFTKGEDSFSIIYSVLKEDSKLYAHTNLNDETKQEYAQLYKTKIQPIISNYFYMFLTILEYIDTSNLPNKKFYTNILRLELSSDELALLFYYIVSGIDINSSKLKDLVEKYTIFKYIQDDMLFGIEHKKYYDNIAYKSKNNV
ncbi:MAG: hypothetical protein RLZZ210_1778 [Pseudomonadota bacterium]|jgi:hypothetical protein